MDRARRGWGTELPEYVEQALGVPGETSRAKECEFAWFPHPEFISGSYETSTALNILRSRNEFGMRVVLDVYSIVSNTPICTGSLGRRDEKRC